MAFSTSPNSKSRRRRADKGGKPSAIKTIVHREVIRELKAFEETKYFDNFTSDPSATTPTFQLLTLIPQGVQQSQRVGDKIMLKGLDVDIIAHYNFSAAVYVQDYYNNLRIDFMRWRVQSSIATPSTAEIYQSVGSFGVQSPFNYETRKNYTILKSVRACLTGYADSVTVNAVPTSNSVFKTKMTVRLNTPIVFDKASTNGDGEIWSIQYSDTVVNPPRIEIMTRVWYTDA